MRCHSADESLAAAAVHYGHAHVFGLAVQHRPHERLLVLLDKLLALVLERFRGRQGVVAAQFFHLLLHAGPQGHAVLVLKPTFGLCLLHLIN